MATMLVALLLLAPSAIAKQHPRSIPHAPPPFGKSYKPVCAPAPKGHLRCLSLIVTNNAGTAVVRHTPAGYGPADLQTAYNLSTLSANAGAGQTVAIVDAGGDATATTDLATYRSTYGLPPANLQIVDQNGGANLPPSAGWEDEISLDLDMVSAIAPNAKILLVEGNSPSSNDLGTAVDMAVALGATQVSNSYGADEVNGAPYASHYNHPGTAIVASTGDSGFGCQQFWQPCYPSSINTVEAVGGTSLNSISPRTESAWGGAGSGCSQQFPKPSWQTDPLCPGRSTSDLSADADPLTGVAVVVNGSFAVIGGTSASSPMIAAVDALLGSQASSAQFYYQNASKLNDVTTGSNDGPGSPCAADFPYLCTAGPGYDGPTGLGTPNGIALARPVPPAAPTAPTASIVAPVNGATFTQGQVVTANYSCTEGARGPGIASCLGPVPSGSAIDTSTLGAHTFTVTARSSDGQTGSASATYTVNAPAPPTASIASPRNGAVFAQNQIVTASYSCREGAGGPGITSCAGPVPNGSRIDTFTPGTHVFTVVARSGDRQTGSATATYTVKATPPIVIPKMPHVTAHPPKSTRSRSATFKFTDATKGVSYLCKLDGAKRFTPCHSPVKYKKLSRKSHTFAVEAVLKGRVSKVARFTWKVRR